MYIYTDSVVATMVVAAAVATGRYRCCEWTLHLAFAEAHCELIALHSGDSAFEQPRVAYQAMQSRQSNRRRYRFWAYSTSWHWANGQRWHFGVSDGQ